MFAQRFPEGFAAITPSGFGPSIVSSLLFAERTCHAKAERHSCLPAFTSVGSRSRHHCALLCPGHGRPKLVSAGGLQRGGNGGHLCALVFRTGVAYRLHIENQGEELQKFAAPGFFGAVEIHTPAVLNADQSEIDIPAGEMRDFLFVAEQPRAFKLRSPDYDWDGMTGDIVITRSFEP